VVLISVAIKFALISFLLTGWLSSHIDYEGLEELRPNLSTRAVYCSRKSDPVSDPFGGGLLREKEDTVPAE
jgi:hypothetical protein